MDDAFLPLGEIVTSLLAFDDEFVDEDSGVRSYIAAYEIETPIELDVTRDLDGSIRVGTVPPLYRVDTSVRPSFHQIRFRAELMEAEDAG